VNNGIGRGERASAHERIAGEKAARRLDREKQAAEQALQREQDKLAIEQDLLPSRSSIRP
jgi:hypothetical protein